MHLELFSTYKAVDRALRSLILAAVPHVYVNPLSHDITGFRNVSALTIMASIWERYRTITQAELAKNLTRMSSPLESASTYQGSLPSAHPRKPVCLQWLRAHCAFPTSSHRLHAYREYQTFRRSMPRMAQNSRHRQKHGHISSTVHRGRARPLLTTHNFQPSRIPRRKRHSSNPHYAFCASRNHSTSNGTRAGYGTRPSHG